MTMLNIGRNLSFGLFLPQYIELLLDPKDGEIGLRFTTLKHDHPVP